MLETTQGTDRENPFKYIASTFVHHYSTNLKAYDLSEFYTDHIILVLLIMLIITTISRDYGNYEGVCITDDFEIGDFHNNNIHIIPSNT